MRRTRQAALLAFVMGMLPVQAVANGRFPEAQRLIEDPNDAGRLFLAGTYGLLMTADRGQNWYYVCETAFALNFLEGDPLFEVLPDGGLLGGIYETLNHSSDCGCTWTTVLAQDTSQNVVDITRDRNGVFLALIEDYSTFPARYRLSESSDGSAWSALADLPQDVPRTQTLDVAPSDPSRIYVSGYVDGVDQAMLLVSEDRGRSWTPREIPATSAAIAPYIAAVDPSDAERVFLRTDDWDTTAEVAARDALLVTTDAGRSFSEVLRRGAKLLGLAVSPDGGSVLVGYGDPVLPGYTTNVEDFGIYKADTEVLSFERIWDLPVGCLRWTATGLYVCAIQNHPDAPSAEGALLFAPNADFTLASAAPFEPLLDVSRVAGVTARITDFNSGRGAGCHLHAMGHAWERYMDSNAVPELAKQAKRFLNWDLDTRVGAPFSNFYSACNSNGTLLTDCMIWESQTRVRSGASASRSFDIADMSDGCGNAHFYPNTTGTYSYDVASPDPTVLTSCENYGLKNGPDGEDLKTTYNNAMTDTLYGRSQRTCPADQPACDDDCGGHGTTYLYQNFPGPGTAATNDDGTPMRDWWVYLFY